MAFGMVFICQYGSYGLWESDEGIAGIPMLSEKKMYNCTCGSVQVQVYESNNWSGTPAPSIFFPCLDMRTKIVMSGPVPVTTVLDEKDLLSEENNGKTKVKEVKSMKVEEVVFHVSAPNYLEFLTTMLAKHNKLLHKVTEKNRYTFKYLPGSSCSIVKESPMWKHPS
ncbi:hypothetical protein BDR07DRAFT_1385671 [Suillus spraguei]|nr:hypothetical protein BDR07DRAFT_1385671 [Suillus spraguei]